MFYSCAEYVIWHILLFQVTFIYFNSGAKHLILIKHIKVLNGIFNESLYFSQSNLLTLWVPTTYIYTRAKTKKCQKAPTTGEICLDTVRVWKARRRRLPKHKEHQHTIFIKIMALKGLITFWSLKWTVHVGATFFFLLNLKYIAVP